MGRGSVCVTASDLVQGASSKCTWPADGGTESRSSSLTVPRQKGPSSPDGPMPLLFGPSCRPDAIQSLTSACLCLRLLLPIGIGLGVRQGRDGVSDPARHATCPACSMALRVQGKRQGIGLRLDRVDLLDFVYCIFAQLLNVLRGFGARDVHFPQSALHIRWMLSGAL